MRSLLWILAVTFAAAQAPPGRRLFEAQCALCHGVSGGGGRGPSLQKPKLGKAPDDAALERVIAEGIGTEMPGAWQLSPNEVKQLAVYVRSLGNIPPEQVPGDGARGRQVYARNGCAQCHMIGGEGSGLGPELTNIGLRRNAAHLRESIVTPAAQLPEGFLMVRVDGVTGVRVAEDPFTIQVQDASGRYHSFRKSAAIERLPKRSPMPAYARLSAADLQDLVAYLAQRKGTK
jgi:putative heme-binding domain-containing protein